MAKHSTRRDFLASAAALPFGGAIGKAAVMNAPPVTATSRPVGVQRDIEPLVRLIEEEPRGRLMGALAKVVREGLAYRDFLAAALMTAIRNWPVDHSVYQMHSVHQLSLDLPAGEQFLPLFWSVDSMKHFRWKQKLKPVNADRYTQPRKAGRLFEEAMLQADRDTAQEAILSLARTEGPRAAFDRFWRWGAGRSGGGNIGHAAIAVANAYRSLNAIGWRHAGPVLQFLTWIGSEATPAASMSWRLKRVEELRPDWAGGKTDRETVLGLIELYRECNPAEAAQTTQSRIAAGELTARPIWDAILVLASEHVMRYRLGGVTGRPLHSVTVANALYTAFQACRKPQERLYLLLEAVHWVAKFYDVERRRGQLRDVDILKIPSVELPRETAEAVGEMFESLPPYQYGEKVADRSAQDRAAAVVFALAGKNETGEFFCRARRYVCRNSSVNAHEYKFPVAVFENFRAVSGEWRPHVLASSVHVLHGSRQAENPAVREARELLGER